MQGSRSTWLWPVRGDCIRSGVARKDVTGQHGPHAQEGSAACQTPCSQEGGRTHSRTAPPTGAFAGGAGRPRRHRPQLHERDRTRRSQLLHAPPAPAGQGAWREGRRSISGVTSRETDSRTVWLGTWVRRSTERFAAYDSRSGRCPLRALLRSWPAWCPTGVPQRTRALALRSLFDTSSAATRDLICHQSGV